MTPHRSKASSIHMGQIRRNVFRVLQAFVLTVGLLAMIVSTVPDLNGGARMSLTIVLWCCLAFFAGEWIVKAWSKPDRKAAYAYILSPAGLIDLLAIVPVPMALLVGVPAATAWLLASLWLLKLAAFTPGLSLLQRVIALEAKPLASVLVIFLVVLLFAAIALYVLEGTAQPDAFRQPALVAVVGGHDPHRHRIWRRRPADRARPRDRRLRHDLRPRGVRPLDRHSRHRFCRRIPTPRLRAATGIW